MNDDELGRRLGELASPVDEVGDLARIRARAEARHRRRSWLRLAAAACTIVVLGALLYGGWLAVQPEPRLVITDDSGSPITGDATTGTSEESTSTTAAAPPESATELVDRAQGALDSLGPVRVLITGTSRGSDRGQEGSDKQTIELLLDQEQHRGLQVLTNSDGSVYKQSVDGREAISYGSSPVSYNRHTNVEPPTGLPLPLPGGYEDALEGARAADMQALPDGGWRLSWSPAVPDESESGAGEVLPVTEMQASIELRADYLPAKLTTHLKGEGFTGDFEFIYTFEEIPPLTSEQVAIEPPESIALGGSTVDLPLDHPRSEGAQWGQYWLGEEVAGYALEMAQHMVFEPDPSYEPRQEGVHLIYRDPSQPEDKNKVIELTTKPLDGNEAKDTRLALADSEPERRTLAGQSAEIYRGGNSYVYEIFLPDAYVVLQVWGVRPEAHDAVLNALRRVE